MASHDHIIGILVKIQELGSQVLPGVKRDLADVNKENEKNAATAQKATTENEKLAAAHSRLSAGLEDEKRRLQENNTALKQNLDRKNAEVAVLRRGTAEQKKEASARAESTQAIASQINANNDRIEQIDLERDKLNESIQTLGVHTDAIDRDRVSIDRTSRSTNRFTQFAERNRSSLIRLSKSADNLERRLALLGRSLLGIVAVSVIVFANSLVSSFAALAGQAVALGGSLIYAAGALGGAFVAGLSQAIPVVGIFIASMQRMSAVMDAVNQHFLVQKQAANRDSTALEAQHNAANAVAQAQQGVADAQRNVQDATEALSQARKDARDQVEDLILAERAEELQLRESILSRKEAEQQLQDAIQSGADPQEIARLRLGVAEANQQVAEQEVAAKRATEEANKARSQGIRGVDSYKSAQEGLADAERALADANKRVAESHHDAAQAATDQSSAQSYLKYFVSQLSDAEKELYRSIVRVKTFFQTQFTDVTDPIIRAFSTGIDRGLAFLKDPDIFNALKGLGQNIGGALNEVTKFLTNPAAERFFGFVIREAGRNLPLLVQGFKALGRIFQNIAVAAAPVLRDFLQFIVNKLQEFNKITGDRQGLEQFFRTGFRFFKAWFDVVTALFDLIGALIGVSKSSAFQTLHSFAETLRGAADSIRNNREEAKQWFEDTAEATSRIGGLLAALGKAVIEAFDPRTVDALADIIETLFIPALEIAIQFTGRMARALDDFLTALGPVGDALGTILGIALAFKSAQFVLLAFLSPIKDAAATAVLSLDTLIARLRIVRGLLAQGQIGGALGALFSSKENIAARRVASTGTSGGGVILPSGVDAAGARRSGISSARSFASGFAGSLGGLFAGLAIFDILDSAMKGDFKEAGIELAGTMIGGIVGFIAGGPAGALLGAGIGDLFAHIIPKVENLFHGTHDLADAQAAAAVSTRQVASAFREERAAIDALRQSHLNEKQARISHQQAILSEKTAEEDLARARKHGSDAEVHAAKLALEQARLTVKQTNQDATRAEKEHTQALNKATEAREKSIDRARENIDVQQRNIDETKETLKSLKPLIEAQRQGNGYTDYGNELIDQQHDLRRDLKDAQDSQSDSMDKLNNQLGIQIDKNGKVNVSIKDTKVKADDTNTSLNKLANQGLTNAENKSDKLRRDGLRPLGQSFDGVRGLAHDMGKTIGDVTNKILDQFGAKKLQFNLPHIARSSSAGLIGPGFQSGGYFGDPSLRGPDDRLIGVAGGEAILTGWQQGAVNTAMKIAQAVGFPYDSLTTLFNRDKREHRTAPKFARGGPVNFFGHPTNVAGPIRALIGIMEKNFPGLAVSSTTDGTHADGSLHYSGHAVDMAAASIEYMRRAADFVKKSGLYKSLAEGIHNPNLSVAGGKFVSPSYWGGATWAGHRDHLHLGITGGGIVGKIASAVAEGIKKITIGGPKGPLKDMLQGQADTLRKAVNKYLNKKIGAAGTEGKGAIPQGTSFKGINSAAEFIPFWNAINPDLKQYARTFAYIVPAESGWNRYADNGNHAGWYQFDAPTWSQFGKGPYPTGPYNPAAATLAAGNVIRREGTAGFGRWVTYHGVAGKGMMVPHFDTGGVVPGPRGVHRLISAAGGETVLPTHQTGGFANDVSQSFRDINQGINQIGRSGSVSRLMSVLTKLLREGGAFDDLAAALEAFQAAISRQTTEWAYRTRRGMVVLARTNAVIANRNLDNLDLVGRKLNREADKIDKLMQQTRRRLQRADDNKEVEKLRAVLNGLRTRSAEIGDALAQNLQDRYQAQLDAFQARIDRFDQRLGTKDLRLQILQATQALTGEDNTAAQAGILQQRGNVLQQEQERIQKELNRAQRRHDTERARELENALLENQLAILENTKTIKELDGTLGTTFDFSSSAWQIWRQAVLNGMGGLMPGFSIPSLQSGGTAMTEGLYHLHPGEVVTPVGNTNDTIIKITEPMEVADPVALSNAIAWKLKTQMVH